MLTENGKNKTSTLTTKSTKNLASRTDSNSLFSMIRQFKSNDLYASSPSKSRLIPRSSKQSPSPSIFHMLAKSQNFEKAAYHSRGKKSVNSLSLFNQLKKQLSTQMLKKEEQRVNTEFNNGKDRRMTEPLNILEIDDSVVEQESEVTIDYEIDERGEREYILNMGKTQQLNNTLVLRSEKISNSPFIAEDNIHNESNGNNKTDANDNINTNTVNSNNDDDPNILCNQMIINAKKGDKETFIDFLNKCLSINSDYVNYLDDNKWAALHYACNEGNLKIVESILRANSNINVLTKTKQTPLHLSAKNGFFDISKLLIDNGALLNSLNNEKNTPMHLCALNGHFELVQYFLEKFPNADMKNIYGKTAYDVAKTQEIKETINNYLKKRENKYHKVPIISPKDDNLNSMLNKHNNKVEKKQISPRKDNTKKKRNFDILRNSPNNNNNNNVVNLNNVNIKTESNIKCNEHLNVTSSSQKSQMKDKPVVNTIHIKETRVNNSNNSHNQVRKTKNVTINLNSQNKTNTSKTGKTTSEFSPYKRQSGNIEHKNKTLNLYRNHSVNTSINKVRLKSNEEESNQIDNNENTKGINQEDQSIDNYSHTDRIHHTEENYLSQAVNSIEEEKITPSSFECLAVLGRGSFGEVFLVRKLDTQNVYAMKVIAKSRIASHNLFKYAMVERNVLSLTNHPFIVKLSYAFQTSDRLFLILEYCSGGDLTKHLYFEKRFNEEKAKYYLCEIILALEDLHKRDIIFRDLKPDNIVLDKDGHVKVTDFGLSKEGVFDSIGAKSFCGSIAYLAPEMLKRTGHGKAVDWYLLGVLFYEMLVGIPPYFTDQKDEIFRNIEHGELQIPRFVSNEAVQILRDVYLIMLFYF